MVGSGRETPTGEDAAVLLDDARRGDVVLITGHKDAFELQPACLFQRQRQNGRAIATAPLRWADGLTDVTADILERRCEVVPQVAAPHDGGATT